MATLVKRLRDDSCIIFDKGRFDAWCVYIVAPNGSRHAPFDAHYFLALSLISSRYPPHKVYSDFVAIYERTTKHIDAQVLQMIDTLSATYLAEDQPKMEQWLTVLYAGMIAEEQKEHMVLKKRIKRLGMHQVLILKMPAALAARYSYGKNWKLLDAEMKELGF